jgi:hypothetical protein
MSQVVEGSVDNLTLTRQALTAGNTANTLKPMDVAEAAYYIQHPEEAPGAQQEPLVAAQGTSNAEAETPADAPEADPLDVEVTPENASLVSQYVTRKEFNHLAERVNHLLFSIEELEGRIEQFNKTAPHKIK